MQRGHHFCGLIVPIIHERGVKQTFRLDSNKRFKHGLNKGLKGLKSRHVWQHFLFKITVCGEGIPLKL
jgi:hypothetical protein